MGSTERDEHAGSSSGASDGGKTSKRTILLFLLAGIVFFKAGSYAASLSRSGHALLGLSFSQSASSSSAITEHPIPKLMAEAETKFRTKLGRQSKTLKAAVAEYKRRYKRDPPKGFDAWWQYASVNGVKMVDEYDGLMADLEPFWALAGDEVRRRAQQAGEFVAIDLVKISKGKVSVSNTRGDEVSGRAQAFMTLLTDYQHLLPDMVLPINAKAEGRVLPAWEHPDTPKIPYKTPTEQQLRPDWQGDGNVWEAFRRTCPPSSQARRLFSSQRPAFVNRSTGIKQDFDFAPSDPSPLSFCDQPWAHYTQGHFFSDWRTLPGLYPVFSAAKAPGFADVRIPSHYYFWHTDRHSYGFDKVNLVVKERDDTETPWEQKTDLMFWRGPTTGGGGSPPGYAPQFQRHRFVHTASDNSSTVNRTVVFEDPPHSGKYTSARVPVGTLNRDIMDIAFVKPVYEDVYPGGEPALRNEHRFDDAVALGEHWRHKYLLDFDGMGYSAKFFAILESDSAAVKSTVYQEYYTDWIQPWLHYIPLTPLYREIYNIHAYFSGPTDAALVAANATALRMNVEERQSEDGDRQLRRIARAGKQWKRTIGRQEDMKVYVYRLCLEYARLSSDRRESMNYNK